jgi:hypothetical protein
MSEEFGIMDEMELFEQDLQEGRSWEDKLAELTLAARIGAAREQGGQS